MHHWKRSLAYLSACRVILGISCMLMLRGELQADSPKPAVQVIAHRGASGYCTEHSEAAKVLAHAQGAPYLEQDVVLTKDHVFVVSHDVTMNATTDVAAIYPDRARADGKHYYVDFTWEELRLVSLVPRANHAASKGAASATGHPAPCGQRIVKLEDEIRLIRSLDSARNQKTGLYIELKSPSFHKRELNVAMEGLLLDFLKQQSVSTNPTDCLIQCFEIETLESLHRNHDCPYALVQLLGGKNADVPWDRIASFAYGVGPSLEMIANRSNGAIESTGFVENARSRGLRVHPYTVRAQSQPSWSSSLDETHRVLIEQLRVDGFFSDYPDLSLAAAK